MTARGFGAGASALALCLLLALAGCFKANAPEPAPSPALWQVTAANGAQGWLFGTIHALPDGTRWRTDVLDEVVAQADLLFVEIADLGEGDAGALIARMGRSDGLPPLLSRIAPQDRAVLAAVLDDAGLAAEDFATTESWAVALYLAAALREGDPANGVDRYLLAQSDAVLGLETLAGQLALFDQLAPARQAALLALTARELQSDQAASLREAWRVGDITGLEAMAQSGVLADPDLRLALQERRNRAWLEPVSEAITAGREPLVAVGAAHMLGPDGLPALLAEEGFTVRRLQ